MVALLNLIELFSSDLVSFGILFSHQTGTKSNDQHVETEIKATVKGSFFPGLRCSW